MTRLISIYGAMNYQFFFEDGVGNIVNENGNDLMDIEGEDPFKLEELTSYMLYIEARSKTCEVLANEDNIVQDIIEVNYVTAESAKNIPKESKIKLRSRDELKAHAVHLVDIHPRNSARVVTLDLNLQPRNVQRWYKAWKQNADSLFKKFGRPRIIEPEGKLAVATKHIVSGFYFKYPIATVDQLINKLTDDFEDFSIKLMKKLVRNLTNWKI
ncbi:uncharacterized protein BX663DRAFT_522174 [Cokeromyces recurvatus]|uniref:uncharacterized protein n=1 Tax=Cokeromyces recurvatus TaxID=90255 RepID=UPI00221EEE41|nr:uncharacterized protein BX663DRAFT_522174 [Cokeromyces recurvatus]KAI7899316.1 hypothetical protein BX663DRAFT_522174 [Cokeromyces recurvatus]